MKLNKLRINHDQKGFTLIELMIVIAIIGILAAIAIPNFIAYRDKAFCSSAESDAATIASGISNYFSVPSRVSFPEPAGYTTSIVFTASDSATLSGNNQADVFEVTNSDGSSSYRILVKDMSLRCPRDYRTSQAAAAVTDEGWVSVAEPPAANTEAYFRKIM